MARTIYPISRNYAGSVVKPRYRGPGGSRGAASGGDSGGGGARFSPSSIAGLQLWLKADAITGLNDNDPVATWADSSGHANDATQGTGTKRPLYKINMLNGKPALRFDDTDDGMVTTASVVLPLTVFCVYNNFSGSGAFRRAVQGMVNNWLIGPYGGFYQAYNGNFLQGPAVTQNLFVISCLRQVTGDAKLFINGSQAATNTSNNEAGQIALAASGAFAEALEGHIAEVIAYDSALSTADRQGIENYLNDKYDIF